MSASKWVRLVVPAGKASAQPPVGPVLGSNGVKAIDFAKQFNARTAHVAPDVPLPVKVYIAGDRSFTFDIKRAYIPYASLYSQYSLLIHRSFPECCYRT